MVVPVLTRSVTTSVTVCLGLVVVTVRMRSMSVCHRHVRMGPPVMIMLIRILASVHQDSAVYAARLMMMIVHPGEFHEVSVSSKKIRSLFGWVVIIVF